MVSPPSDGTHYVSLAGSVSPSPARPSSSAHGAASPIWNRPQEGRCWGSARWIHQSSQEEDAARPVVPDQEYEWVIGPEHRWLFDRFLRFHGDPRGGGSLR